MFLCFQIYHLIFKNHLFLLFLFIYMFESVWVNTTIYGYQKRMEDVYGYQKKTEDVYVYQKRMENVYGYQKRMEDVYRYPWRPEKDFRSLWDRGSSEPVIMSLGYWTWVLWQSSICFNCVAIFLPPKSSSLKVRKIGISSKNCRSIKFILGYPASSWATWNLSLKKKKRQEQQRVKLMHTKNEHISWSQM